MNSLNEIQSSKVKYGIWYSPSKFDKMYGLMFNFWARDDWDSIVSYPAIYGLELNLNPVGIFIPFVLLVHSIDPETHAPMEGNPDTLNFHTYKFIHGMQLGFINLEPSVINGLDVNVAGSFGSVSNGITISAIMNKHFIINGISLAGIANHDLECKGIQIGLWNSARRLKGFQLGLWNTNQCRSLPFINWCFR